MALPKLATPEFNTVIPSTKENIRYRPFLVGEEKILFMAQESKNNKDIFNATLNILRSCILTKGIKYEELTSYDLEFLFLMLRAKSVGEIITLKMKHANKEFADKCDHTTKIDLNIEDIKIKYKEGHNNKIFLTEDIGMILKDPKASDTNVMELSNKKNKFDNVINLMHSCTVSLFDKETVYPKSGFTEVEFKSFIEKLNKAQFQKIVEFFDTLPVLSHTFEFVCEKCKNKETVTIEGLNNFFT